MRVQQFSDDPAEKREVKRRVNELLRKEMNSLLLKHRGKSWVVFLVTFGFERVDVCHVLSDAENIEKEQERQQELEGSNEKLQRHEERLASEVLIINETVPKF